MANRKLYPSRLHLTSPTIVHVSDRSFTAVPVTGEYLEGRPEIAARALVQTAYEDISTSRWAREFIGKRAGMGTSDQDINEKVHLAAEEWHNPDNIDHIQRRVGIIKQINRYAGYVALVNGVIERRRLTTREFSNRLVGYTPVRLDISPGRMPWNNSDKKRYSPSKYKSVYPGLGSGPLFLKEIGSDQYLRTKCTLALMRIAVESFINQPDDIGFSKTLDFYSVEDDKQANSLLEEFGFNKVEKNKRTKKCTFGGYLFSHLKLQHPDLKLLKLELRQNTDYVDPYNLNMPNA